MAKVWTASSLAASLQPTPSGCLIWTGRIVGKGYGQTYHIGKNWRVHRLSWHLTFGPIPDKYHVLHKCDNPPCANLDHLFLGTNQDNIADKMLKGRMDHLRGEGNPMVKLTEFQVREIKDLYRRGFGSMQAIANKFGVSKKAVWLIIHDINWKYLDCKT